MKKFLKLFLSAFLVLTVVVSEHVHDENCGYDPETETGCIYDLESAGFVPPGEEDPSN